MSSEQWATEILKRLASSFEHKRSSGRLFPGRLEPTLSYDPKRRAEYLDEFQRLSLTGTHFGQGD